MAAEQRDTRDREISFDSARKLKGKGVEWRKRYNRRRRRRIDAIRRRANEPARWC
jgi:hypothetical protein